MKQPRLTLALAALVIGCIALDVGVLWRATPAIVDAEERGVSVDLTYQRGHSTWGPTNAYGTAVLWPLEGVATLTVHLLPHLEHGDRYVWWVMNTHSGATKHLGTFNTTAAGNVFLDTFVAGSLPRDADAVLVSIAPAGDPLAAPSARRTLYGDMATQSHLLPAAALQGTPGQDRSATPQPGTDGSGIYRAPVSLPMTGGAQLAHARRPHDATTTAKKEG